MDKQYDLFVAGIQAEYQDNADQIIKTFARLFPEYQSLTEALRRSKPQECCLARKIDLQQAERRQRQLARIGLICRYRPALNQTPAFSLEPLPPPTITCPFCQHQQPRPEKLQGKRCEHCNAKMILFEKRRKILERPATKKTALQTSQPLNKAPAAFPAEHLIKQAEQKQQQHIFSSSLLGFTLTAIVAISAFAAYQLSLPPTSQPAASSHQLPVVQSDKGSKPEPIPTVSPSEHQPRLQQRLKAGVFPPPAEKVVTKNPKINLDNRALAAIDSLLNNASVADAQELMTLSETAKPFNPADLEKLASALEQSIKSAPDNVAMQRLLEQALTALPPVGNASEIIGKPPLFKPWRSRPTKPEQDIFAVLYAMEAFNQANTKNSEIHQLLRQYTLQKKFLQQYREMFTHTLNKSLNIHENIPGKLHESLMRWLYPKTADVILSARSNPVTLDILSDKQRFIHH